jgi:hypothetical protein
MGKVGRPSNPNSQYTMQVHKNGKYLYADTQRAVTGDDGIKRYKHVHWGTLDDQSRFHPNHAFLYQSPKRLLASFSLRAGISNYSINTNKHYPPQRIKRY